MKKIYLDASALVMLFYTKQDRKGIVRQLFQLANLGRVQIFFSYWAANEALAAIDRVWRRKDIDTPQRNLIIATVIKRAKGWSEGKESGSNIFCIEVNNKLLTLSREFILLNHISADDALHVYSAFDKECEFFVFRDKKLSRQFGEKINNTTLIDLAVDKDVQKLYDSLDSG